MPLSTTSDLQLRSAHEFYTEPCHGTLAFIDLQRHLESVHRSCSNNRVAYPSRATKMRQLSTCLKQASQQGGKEGRKHRSRRTRQGLWVYFAFRLKTGSCRLRLLLARPSAAREYSLTSINGVRVGICSKFTFQAAISRHAPSSSTWKLL